MINARFVDWIVADNWGGGFTGAGMGGQIVGALIVGKSLNIGVETPESEATRGPRFAAASYHSTFLIYDNFIVN